MNEEIHPGFTASVNAESKRMLEKGYDAAHDDKEGIEHLLSQAYLYAAKGQTVKAAVMISAAGAWVQRNVGGKNIMQRKIEEFMLACDQEVRKYPGLPAPEVKRLRILLILQEFLGSRQPNRINLEGTEFDLIKDKSDELIQSLLNDDLNGIADGIADVLVVVIGCAAAYGIDIQEFFDEVMRSNMSKAVWDEETKSYKVIKDEFGKVQKPASYSPPQLEPILETQILEGRLREVGDIRDV